MWKKVQITCTLIYCTTSPLSGSPTSIAMVTIGTRKPSIPHGKVVLLKTIKNVSFQSENVSDLNRAERVAIKRRRGHSFIETKLNLNCQKNSALFYAQHLALHAMSSRTV
jgi:hypothetical protein